MLKSFYKKYQISSLQKVLNHVKFPSLQRLTISRPRRIEKRIRFLTFISSHLTQTQNPTQTHCPNKAAVDPMRRATNPNVSMRNRCGMAKSAFLASGADLVVRPEPKPHRVEQTS